jgi:hypothetical protein
MKRKYNADKYIYQKKNFYSYQCGPFAIYNLLIKHNMYYDLLDIIKLCDANPIDGTISNNMNNAIKEINSIMKIKIKSLELYPTKLDNELNIKNINNIMEKKSCIILLFHWTENNPNYCSSGEHYILIESLYKNKYKIINYSFDEEIKYISIRELKEFLLYYKKNTSLQNIIEEYPKAWYL